MKESCEDGVAVRVGKAELCKEEGQLRQPPAAAVAASAATVEVRKKGLQHSRLPRAQMSLSKRREKERKNLRKESTHDLFSRLPRAQLSLSKTVKRGRGRLTF